MKKAHLDGWSIHLPDRRYALPHEDKKVFFGIVKNHADLFLNGKLVHTSLIQQFDESGAKTSNTAYTLGEMWPDFGEFLKDNNLSIEDYYVK